MVIQAYLQRINYTGPLVPSAETLRLLQVAHLQTVPFENLSIHSGEPIVLDDEALFEKIVRRRRGGFCYELNGLFAACCARWVSTSPCFQPGLRMPKGSLDPTLTT